MPELEIIIGGRGFQVVCQEGEEHFLHSAAKMLDQEAQPILAQMGRLTEGRMLLMAGLMLADKTAAVEDETGRPRLGHPCAVEAERFGFGDHVQHFGMQRLGRAGAHARQLFRILQHEAGLPERMVHPGAAELLNKHSDTGICYRNSL